MRITAMKQGKRTFHVKRGEQNPNERKGPRTNERGHERKGPGSNISTKGATTKGARLKYLCYSSLMPRRPRIHFDGIPLHIVQRGTQPRPLLLWRRRLRRLPPLARRSPEEGALRAACLYPHDQPCPPTGYSRTCSIHPAVHHRPRATLRAIHQHHLPPHRYSVGTAVTNPPSSRPKRICSAASATLNSTPCAPAWSTIQCITAGPVIAATPWGKPTPIFHRTRSTSRLGGMTAQGRQPTETCSAQNWTTKPSATSA